MTVGILEIPAIAAPEGFVRRPRDASARSLGSSHYLVHLSFTGYVVTDAELGGTARSRVDSGIQSKIPAREEAERHAAFEAEERNRPVPKLLPDDAFRR